MDAVRQKTKTSKTLVCILFSQFAPILSAKLPIDEDGEIILSNARPATTTRMRSQDSTSSAHANSNGKANGSLDSSRLESGFLDVHFKAFAPTVFASMRAAMGISNEEFLNVSF